MGRDVVRAPYPGIMGAIGMALIAKEKYEKSPETEEIWDLQNLDTFLIHRMLIPHVHSAETTVTERL